MNMSISNQRFWDCPFDVDHNSLSEILYWRARLNLLQKCRTSIVDAPSNDPLFVFTDASDIGGGGYLQGDTQSICSFRWNSQTCSSSSTYREITYKCCLSHKVQYRDIVWKTDSQNAVRIMEKGSMRPDLHAVYLCKNLRLL